MQRPPIPPTTAAGATLVPRHLKVSGSVAVVWIFISRHLLSLFHGRTIISATCAARKRSHCSLCDFVQWNLPIFHLHDLSRYSGDMLRHELTLSVDAKRGRANR